MVEKSTWLKWVKRLTTTRTHIFDNCPSLNQLRVKIVIPESAVKCATYCAMHYKNMPIQIY